MGSSRLRIGSFAKDETGALYGSIGALGMGSTRVISVADETADGRPFLRLIGDPLGAAYEVGVAFAREKEGLHYYSVLLDSPTFEAPMNVALFPDRGSTTAYNMVWSRSEGPGVAPELQGQMGQPQGRRPLSRSVTP